MQALKKDIESTVKAKSHFQVFKRTSESADIIPLTGKVNNQITDFGYQSAYGGSNVHRFQPGSNSYSYAFAYLKIGASTTPIVAADTGMSSVLGTVASNTNPVPQASACTLEVIGGVRYSRVDIWYSFALGQLDNVTFSQVGIFSGNNNTSLICGQLTKDSEGDLTSITILATEQLMIKYTSYWPTIQQLDFPSFVLNFASVNYTVTVSRPEDPNDAFWMELPGSGQNIWVNGGSANVGTYTVVTTNYANRVERVITVSTNLLSMLASINTMVIRGSAGINPLYLTFSPALPKSAYNVITFSFRWSIKWREA